VNGPDDVIELTCDEVREMAGAFVLGALEPTDDAAVRAHLATCPEAHEEIAELGGVLPVLAESVPVVEPPDGLKARIMAAAAADLEERTGRPVVAAAREGVVAPPTAVPVTAPTPATAEPIAFPSASERMARRSRTSSGTWILRIAAVVAIVGLVGWNLLLQNQLNASKDFEQNVAAVLTAAAQPGSLTAVLTPDDGTGSGLAAITADGEVALAMHDLAPTTGSTVYTTWAIGADGVPLALGDFTVGSDGKAFFDARTAPVASGTVIALTHEPTGGHTAPTGPVVSKGVATEPA
jgi:anti-sigma-K factor RskA